MRICLINNLTSDSGRGGAAVAMEASANKLREEGNDVVVIAIKQFSIFNFQFSIEEVAGIKNYKLPSLYSNLKNIPSILRIFWHLWDMFDIFTALKVKRILKEEKIDLVITHNLKGLSYLIPKIIKSLNVKHEHVLHDIQLIHPSGLMFYGEEKKINSFPSKMYTAICRNLFGSPDKIISPSQWLLKMHVDRGFFKNSEKEVKKNPSCWSANVVSRDNAMEQDVIDPHGRPRTTNELFRFLFIGQLEKHKGILLLINAFKKLKEAPFDKGIERKSGFELWIAGQGSLEKEAREISKDNNIKFLGWDVTKETEWMRQADCLVVPSLCYENSPTVICKAQSIGLPVIASNLGGIPELIPDKKFLFKPTLMDLSIKLNEFCINKNI